MMHSIKRPAEVPIGDWIDVDEPEALESWARKFDVPKERLRKAVAVVGQRAEDVAIYLNTAGSAADLTSKGQD